MFRIISYRTMCFGLGLSAEGLAGVVVFLRVEEDEAAGGELAAEEAGQLLKGTVVGDRAQIPRVYRP